MNIKITFCGRTDEQQSEWGKNHYYLSLCFSKNFNKSRPCPNKLKSFLHWWLKQNDYIYIK